MSIHQSHHERPYEALEILAPINRSGLALLAGYVGLASILILPAPIAIVVGALALRDLSSKPDKTGHGRAWFAIVAGAIGTFVMVAGAIAAIAHRHH